MSLSIDNSSPPSSPAASENICKHEKLVVDDHCQVCESCGLIIDEEDYLSTPYSLIQPFQQSILPLPLPKRANRFRFRSRQDYNLYTVRKALERILVALTLPTESLSDQCQKLLYNFLNLGPVGMLQICLAYVYHKSRLEGWPLTLSQLSAVSSQPTFKILRSFSVLLERGLIEQIQQPSPAIFFERALQQMKRSLLEAKIFLGLPKR